MTKGVLVTYCMNCSVNIGAKGIMNSSTPKPMHPAIVVKAEQKTAKCPKCEEVFPLRR